MASLPTWLPAAADAACLRAFPAPAYPAEMDPDVWCHTPVDLLPLIASSLVRINITPGAAMEEQGRVRAAIALIGRPFATGVAAVPIDATVLRSVSSTAAQWAVLATRCVGVLRLMGRPSLTPAEHALTQGGIQCAAAGGQLEVLLNATLQAGGAGPAENCWFSL